MLVLSRKAGQELVIDDRIRITVNRISGSRVTLGISAPGQVRIVRGELVPVVDSFRQPDTDDPSGGSVAEASLEWHVESVADLSDLSRQVH